MLIATRKTAGYSFISKEDHMSVVFNTGIFLLMRFKNLKPEEEYMKGIKICVCPQVRIY